MRGDRAAVDEDGLLVFLPLARGIVSGASILRPRLLDLDNLVERGTRGAPNVAVLGEAEALGERAIHALFNGRLLLQHLAIRVQLQQASAHRVGPGHRRQLLHLRFRRALGAGRVRAEYLAVRGLHLGHVLELLTLEDRVGRLHGIGLRRLGLDLRLEPREAREFRRIGSQGFVAELLLRLDVDPLQIVEVAALFLDVIDLHVDVAVLLAVDLLQDGVRLPDAPGQPAH